jgi:carbon monoxide dehydrogenase subunit G
VTIETPVEKVLEFVDDPENLATCAPMVERVVEVVRSGQRVGNSFRVIYRVLGTPVNEEFRVIGFEPRAGIHLTVDSRSGKRFTGA